MGLPLCMNTPLYNSQGNELIQHKCGAENRDPYPLHAVIGQMYGSEKGAKV